jgi:hypothetical protein
MTPRLAITTRNGRIQIRNQINPQHQIHDPDKVRVPAYHPDTPEVRRNWAQYYDRLTMMDALAGANLRELEEAGLAEDTIVFYYGDHGPGMPRGKRWLYDAGIIGDLGVYQLVSTPDGLNELIQELRHAAGQQVGQIPPSRPYGFRALLVDDEGVGRDRQQFVEDEEREQVGRERQSDGCGQSHREAGEVAGLAMLTEAADVADREHGREQPQGRRREREHHAGRVGAQGKADAGRE